MKSFLPGWMVGYEWTKAERRLVVVLYWISAASWVALMVGLRVDSDGRFLFVSLLQVAWAVLLGAQWRFVRDRFSYRTGELDVEPIPIQHEALRRSYRVLAFASILAGGYFALALPQGGNLSSLWLPDRTSELLGLVQLPLILAAGLPAAFFTWQAPELIEPRTR